MEIDKEKLTGALYKRALGYTCDEQNEEYALQDGQMQLVKRKVTYKEIPPELSAIKMLLEETKEDYSYLTEEELEKEKARLLLLLVECDKEKNKKIKK